MPTAGRCQAAGIAAARTRYGAVGHVRGLRAHTRNRGRTRARESQRPTGTCVFPPRRGRDLTRRDNTRRLRCHQRRHSSMIALTCSGLSPSRASPCLRSAGRRAASRRPLIRQTSSISRREQRLSTTCPYDCDCDSGRRCRGTTLCGSHEMMRTDKGMTATADWGITWSRGSADRSAIFPCADGCPFVPRPLSSSFSIAAAAAAPRWRSPRVNWLASSPQNGVDCDK
jgi:hypothetical protein